MPGSKRYAEDESEYAIILERYNTVLEELFAGTDIYVIVPEITSEPEVPSHRPDAGYWRTVPVQDSVDPRYCTYYHLFFVRRPWRYGCLDDLLRGVADEDVVEVLITDTQMRRIHHPYDGGADVFLTSTAERDRFRDWHADWLSGHPSGL